MYPHPVYIPTGEIRALRMLQTRRRLILIDRNRWYAARATRAFLDALEAEGETLTGVGDVLRPGRTVAGIADPLN